jgi:hypothetical protein
MPFEPMETGRASRSTVGTEHNVCIGLYPSGGERALCFRFGAQVVASLGWTAGELIIVDQGTGRDAGVLQLRHDPKGKRLSRGSESDMALVMKTGTRRLKLYSYTIERSGMVEVNHTVFGGILMVKVPSWMVFAHEVRVELAPTDSSMKTIAPEVPRGRGRPESPLGPNGILEGHLFGGEGAGK